jgi:hypothetical protein
MGDPQLITFSYKELATVLIKHHGLHEGLWNVFVQAGIMAGPVKTGPSEEDVVPGLILPLARIGLQKQDKATPLSVDAAEVNPPSKA